MNENATATATAETAQGEPAVAWNFAVAGVSALCDAWALDGSNLAFLSVIGPTATIKSLRSHFGAAGPSHTGTLYPDGGGAAPWKTFLNLQPLTRAQRWQRPLTALPGQHHLLLMPPGQAPSRANFSQPATTVPATDENYSGWLFSEAPEHGPRLLGERLRRETGLIALPQWDQAIWDYCVEQEWITPLSAWRAAPGKLYGWQAHVNWTELQEALCQRLAAGELAAAPE